MSQTPSEAEPPGGGQGVRREVDVDRGPLVGFAIAVAMFFVFQAMILAAFQLGVIGGETPFWVPLKFAGFTQGIYVLPSLLLFINRRCPRMAGGFAAFAGLVLIGSIVSLIV